MRVQRKWAYVLGTLALTIGLSAALIAITPGARQPAPQASPGPQAAQAPPQAAAPALPKATAAQGQQPLLPTVEGGVKTFDLVVRKMQWDIGGGDWREAYTINGMVPGPEIRVNEGERVRFRVRNEMDEPTSMHWHGMILPSGQDGVAHLTQDPIEPGETFTYEFNPSPAGSHWYHSHFNGGKQVTGGLYGPLIVVPKDPSHPTHPSKYDVDHTIMINDAGTLGLLMSGKNFPHNLPMKTEKGQRFLLRLINTGVGPHPMHLHGHDFRVVAKDGNPVPQPAVMNTININAGETYDLLLPGNNPGSWLFHCHILPHAEGPDGMFGLTALLEYKGYEPDPNSKHIHGMPSEKRLPGTPGKHTH